SRGLGDVYKRQGLPMILFLTDGLPTVGETDVERILKNARERNAKAARIFAFGVGFDVNAHLLDRLAEEGRGARDYVKPQENIELKVSNLYTKIASPVLSDVEVIYDGVKVEDVYPKRPADIFRGSQLILLGRFEGQGEQSLRVRGKVAGQDKEYVYRVVWGEKAGAPFMPTLWAMRKVGYLLDEIRLRGANQELIDEVTRLGKKYGIVTPYTSFLVVDDGTMPPPPGQPVPLPGPIVGREEARQIAKEAADAASRDFAAAPAAGERAQEASRTAGRFKGDALGAGGAPSLEMAEAGPDDSSLQAARAKARERGGAAADRLTRAPIRRIEGKTFVWQDGVWTDSEYDPAKVGQTVEVEFVSGRYFDLLQTKPALAKFFALGENVVVVWEGVVYRVKKG
ncbi:MAG: hypothetical protein N3A66_09160, partial [Planctomycetota bacterium]|nr:hypothetical protein [Planctomycetota bacterium]